MVIQLKRSSSLFFVVGELSAAFSPILDCHVFAKRSICGTMISTFSVFFLFACLNTEALYGSSKTKLRGHILSRI